MAKRKHRTAFQKANRQLEEEGRKQTDKHGNAFWYCHRRGFPNVPIFGSIGSYQKTKSVCDMYNGVEKKQKERKNT